MSSMNSKSLYIGSGDAGVLFERRLKDMVMRRRGKVKSESELMREYIERGLAEDEKTYPPMPAAQPTEIAA